MASALIVLTPPASRAESNSQKKPPADAQSVLDSLNNERHAMTTADGDLDPQEVEHVQRMLRIYELRAGFADVQPGNRDASLASDQGATETAQTQPLQNDVQQLRSEILDLRQQLLDTQPSRQSQGNGRIINDAAGAPNDPRQYPPYYSTPRYYRHPGYW
ncbi:MAG: hypothetical protein JWM68_2820 [Verrucomicrobiales bacterium]|nr:hypothetical protein [Verrucomicrobiales bacterium]